ncbi:CDP-glucose 4,6-dehydratase [Devosia sp.]|uniref:CDP-glucose 4,6-dehydratase n=1 Tax=Devosia sp. TaxID=1871048 RepID=UPI0025BFF2EF|nr:CDP-glucose 4,6-dehydratase [Devosia sp.]
MANLAGRRVFLTGHTGFKGSWMVALLRHLGTEVFGYALQPSSTPNLAELAGIGDMLANETIADIRDAVALRQAVLNVQPDLVIHMAAQALVRPSYSDPIDTWSTNVMGTVNLLDAARNAKGIAGIVIVTTDKCYENRAWEWGYRETDALGGHDPYSASKAATELVAQSYRKSFFNDGGTLIATARAGNVIGGGDWSQDRLVADAARAAASRNALVVRNPDATRPWQHVLDCLSGYLTLGSALLAGKHDAATAYNFGPDPVDNVSVGQLLTGLSQHWPELRWQVERQEDAPHEAAFLYLDSSRARRDLQWKSRWGLDKALQQTAVWYRSVAQNSSVAPSLIASQIDEFLQ